MRRWPFFVLVPLAACSSPMPPVAVIHDNEIPAGSRNGDTVSVTLQPVQAMWYPETTDDPGALVWAIAADGDTPMIPAPLLRGNEATVFRITLRNPHPDSTLMASGFGTRPGGGERIAIAPGGDTTISFVAGAAGTYFYAFEWGEQSELVPPDEALLAGAFVVEGPESLVNERIFIASSWLVEIDSTLGAPFVTRDWLVINGRSFPHNRTIDATQGDTMHWRWINASHDSHPIHLHGDHFQVIRRGNMTSDEEHWDQEVVTVMMLPGQTFTAMYTPNEPGNWALHCHFAFHTSHFLSTERVTEPEDIGAPDAVRHDVYGMKGMLVRVKIHPAPDGSRRPAVVDGARQVRLVAMARDSVYRDAVEGFAFVESYNDSLPESLPKLSPTLVLNRGEPVAITVVNRLRAPTAVHWHGMELPSYSDGIPGWSGGLPEIAGLIAPGDSFVARFTPPRAGTFIYHAHSNEMHQIAGGLYGAMLVVDPETWQPERERVVVIGGDGYFSDVARVNGMRTPDPIEVPADEQIRLRIVNIQVDFGLTVQMLRDTVPMSWIPVAKDGAELPTERKVATSESWLTGPGETADFEVTLPRGEYRLLVRQYFGDFEVPLVVRSVR